MSDLIQWPRAQYWDKPWNPIIGCNPISPACANCYAKAWAERFGQSFAPHLSTREKPPRKGVVFCGNMTDLFGEWVERPSDYLLQTVGGDATAYLYLTKRVAIMCARLNDTLGFVDEEGEVYFRHYYNLGIENHYFGFTAENQEWYEKRLSEWIEPWANPLDYINGWLSCEPLLEPIDLHFYTYWNIPKWLVVGCESGQKRRPCKLEWVESIVDQCRTAGVPVFVKQLDLNGKCERDIAKFPKHLQIRQVPWAKNGGAR